MQFDITTQRLPKIYKRGNKDCYLDPVRKKLIYITPEETIRQKVISYLIDVLEVPAEVISVEAHLSHYGVKSKRRADIIIHGADEEGRLLLWSVKLLELFLVKRQQSKSLIIATRLVAILP